MDRRQFVAALASTLAAGCSGDREAPGSTTTAGRSTSRVTATTPKTTVEASPGQTTTRTSQPETTTTETTTTTEPETLRRVTVASGEVSEEHEVVLSAGMIRSEATTRRPARVLVVFTNTASRRRSFTTGFRPTFSGVYSEESTPGLVLLSPDEDYERTDAGCWRPTLSPGVPESATTWSLGEVESSYVVLDVWDHPDNDDCLPPGTYCFEDDYEADRPGGDGAASFSLGFDLSVEAP